MCVTALPRVATSVTYCKCYLINARLPLSTFLTCVVFDLFVIQCLCVYSTFNNRETYAYLPHKVFNVR